MNLLDKEQYENVIGLLKKALEFYADEINYRPKIEKEPPVIIDSKINLDNGEHARFTLELVEKILKEMDQTSDNYDDLIKNAEEENIDPKKIISRLKNLNNG